METDQTSGKVVGYIGQITVTYSLLASHKGIKMSRLSTVQVPAFDSGHHEDAA